MTGQLNRSILEHWKLLLFWPVYGLAFYLLEWVFPQSYYKPMHHPLDDLIPFCEWFVSPYVAWFFIIPAMLLLMHSIRQQKGLCSMTLNCV